MFSVQERAHRLLDELHEAHALGVGHVVRAAQAEGDRLEEGQRKGDLRVCKHNPGHNPETPDTPYLQTLDGPFSAVSKPNFASKYSSESSWRDLQDLHAFAPLSIQNFSQISSIFFAFSQFCFQNFTDFFKTLSKIHEI